jgi:hypothetical protein
METTQSRTWSTRLLSALAAGAAGAIVAAIAIVAVYQRSPAIRLDMERLLPGIVTGLYPPEREGKRTFAWTGGSVELGFDHVDRRIAWLCRAEAINWRPASAGAADLRVDSDGRILLSRVVTGAREILAFTVPPAPGRSSLRFGIAVSPTFRPGPQDRRDLGLAFDWIACEPVPGFRPWPAVPIIAQGAAAAAVAGVAIGLAGLPAAVAIVASILVAGAQAIALATGGAPYTLGSPPALSLAVLLAVFCLSPVFVAGRLLGRTLSTPARLAIVVSACACYLKLLFLLHPDKSVVDALFHAHRLDWVLAGRFYFTQLSTSATPFPYAIGLYVFSAPWSLLTGDHVTLLRVVVCVSEALAGALLYPTIVRAWNDPPTGVMAVVLFHLLPLPYAVIGNANLTNAFGQSVALVTMTAAATWAFGSHRLAQLAGLTALAAFAFLSHVGTFAVLLPTLLTLAWLCYANGGPANRGPARHILVAVVLAVLLAVALYYAHFGDVYRPHLAGARARVAVLLGAGGEAMQPKAASGSPSVRADAQGHGATPLQLGVKGALNQTRWSLGWPIIILAFAGVWSLVARRRVDRLVLALAAWIAACLGFLGWSAIRAVEPQYVQDAWEFIGRVELATSPAAAILAASGAVWAWRAGAVPRVASGALLLAALMTGARALGAWIF